MFFHPVATKTETLLSRFRETAGARRPRPLKVGINTRNPNPNAVDSHSNAKGPSSYESTSPTAGHCQGDSAIVRRPMSLPCDGMTERKQNGPASDLSKAGTEEQAWKVAVWLRIANVSFQHALRSVVNKSKIQPNG